MPEPARTFISYSRKDGAKFAAALRKRLLKQGLSIWQDLIALEGGRDWWSQIEDALKSKALQHFVVVVTPGALESKVVSDEIRLARQEGKTVWPVKGPGLGDLGMLRVVRRDFREAIHTRPIARTASSMRLISASQNVANAGPSR